LEWVQERRRKRDGNRRYRWYRENSPTGRASGSDGVVTVQTATENPSAVLRGAGAGGAGGGAWPVLGTQPVSGNHQRQPPFSLEFGVREKD
jgi:hypothetical protein